MTFSQMLLVFGCLVATFSDAQQVVPDQALLAVYGDPYGTPYYGPSDYDECRVNRICPDGWCINYDGSYECKCNYGFKQTPDRKGCTHDTKAPFTNTHGFRDFLRSIGYKNPDMYLAPPPLIPQQHTQVPEIHVPQVSDNHAPQNHAYPQPFDVHQSQNQYNPSLNTIQYQQPSAVQYDPQQNPSQYNHWTYRSHSNSQTSTTTPLPVDVEPNEAPPAPPEIPTQNTQFSLENQIIDQNLQMMWEDPYGPKRPAFLDQTPAELNTPKSSPSPSNQVYHPPAPTLPESQALLPFPSYVPSYGNQAQNQGSWVESLGPERPAFLDQPITRPPHQTHDPSGQFHQQVPQMSVEQGLAPNDAMGSPGSGPNPVLWNSNPSQQFPVMNVPTFNAGTPPEPIPVGQPLSSMSVSPEYNPSPNNSPSPYSYSYPPPDLNNPSVPLDVKVDLPSVPMASSDVPIISHHANHYPGAFADPSIHPNPYQYPENKFGQGYNQWQQSYPSYPVHDPYTDVTADSSNRLQTDSQSVPNEGIPSTIGKTKANEPPPSTATSSPTSETITTTTAVTDVTKITEAAAGTTTLVADATTTTTSAPDTTTTTISIPTTTTSTPFITTPATTSIVASTTTTATTPPPPVELASTWVEQTGQNLKISLGVDLSGTSSHGAPAEPQAASFKIQAEGVPNDIAPGPTAPSSDTTTLTTTAKVTTVRTVSPPTSTKTPSYTRTTRQPILVPVVPASNDRFDITNSQVSKFPGRPQSPNIIPKQYIMKIPPEDNPRQISSPNQQPRPNYLPSQQLSQKSPPIQQPRPNAPARLQSRPNYPARRPIVDDTNSPQRAPQAQVVHQIKIPPNVQYPVRTQNQPQMKNIPLQLYPEPRQYPVTTRKQYVLNVQNRPGQLTRQYPATEELSRISNPPFRVTEHQIGQHNIPKYQKEQHSTTARHPAHQMKQHPFILHQSQPNYPYAAPNVSPQFSSRRLEMWTNTVDRQMYNVHPSRSSVQSPQRLFLARPTTSSHSSWINAGTSEQGNTYDAFSNTDVLMTLLISQLLN
ncbi:uncharacterized protein [Haliotis asinina]|uniref:uncharacterized protein n=1 Tax=Haliotis asinina TaxID=109174 RepID=UPI00353198F6